VLLPSRSMMAATTFALERFRFWQNLLSSDRVRDNVLCHHRYPVFTVFFSYLLWKGRGRVLDLNGIVPGQAMCGSQLLRNEPGS